ncbi:unnamed protein product [Taenia asiatica]|uniref:Secreted protein n=1 Tax=Taenia asiatica TaxID=60517 RepID=A0A0R3WBM6_TAEAS|nr:unnamed protein product [Taenia asiatica]
MTVFTSFGEAFPEASLISSTNTPSYLLVTYRRLTHRHGENTEDLHHFTFSRLRLTKHLHVEASHFHTLFQQCWQPQQTHYKRQQQWC